MPSRARACAGNFPTPHGRKPGSLRKGTPRTRNPRTNAYTKEGGVGIWGISQAGSNRETWAVNTFTYQNTEHRKRTRSTGMSHVEIRPHKVTVYEISDGKDRVLLSDEQLDELASNLAYRLQVNGVIAVPSGIGLKIKTLDETRDKYVHLCHSDEVNALVQQVVTLNHEVFRESFPVFTVDTKPEEDIGVVTCCPAYRET